MIRGVVNVRNEIQIPLPILDATGYEQAFDAVVDTGFNGSVTLPASLIASLQLPWADQAEVRFADGHVEWIDFYEVTVVWDGVDRRIRAQAIDGDVLIRMALLSGFDLRARVVIGGRVDIEAVP